MRWNILQAYCRRPSSTLTSGEARYCAGYQEAFEQVLESLMAGGDDLVESDGDKKGLDWLVEVNVLTLMFAHLLTKDTGLMCTMAGNFKILMSLTLFSQGQKFCPLCGMIFDILPDAILH